SAPPDSLATSSIAMLAADGDRVALSAGAGVVAAVLAAESLARLRAVPQPSAAMAAVTKTIARARTGRGFSCAFMSTCSSLLSYKDEESQDSYEVLRGEARPASVVRRELLRAGHRHVRIVDVADDLPAAVRLVLPDHD